MQANYLEFTSFTPFNKIIGLDKRVKPGVSTITVKMTDHQTREVSIATEYVVTKVQELEKKCDDLIVYVITADNQSVPKEEIQVVVTKSKERSFQGQPEVPLADSMVLVGEDLCFFSNFIMYNLI